MMQTHLHVESVPHGFEFRRIEVGGVQIAAWERGGAAPALLLVHGNSACKAAFRDLLLEPALAGRRLVAIDLAGCGESDNAADERYTIPAFAHMLLELTRRMSLDRPVVVGWSLGGHVAIEAVGQEPGTFRALVLTGTPPCGPGGAELVETFHASELMDVTSAESPPPELLDRYVRALYGSSKPVPSELCAAARRCDGRMRRLLVEHWVSGIEGMPQRRVVADWPGAIALIQGDQEPFFDPRLLDTLAWKHLWRGQVQFVRDAGHAPFFEQPARYADLMTEFLQSLAA